MDLVGQTTTREFIRLMYQAAGVLCPVTFAMHLAAAVETKPGQPQHRPCVVVAGGREPPQWEAYPHHQYLSTNGALTCCASGGCWKSRCQLVGDSDEKDRNNLCEQPVQVRPDLRIPRCMPLITPADVIRRIELYYEGGALRYPLSQTPLVLQRSDPPTLPEVTAPIQTPPPSRASRMNVLVRFRHGLGDAVQMTSLLAHLKHYHPEWEVDVAALVGKHTAYAGLCSRAFALDRDKFDATRYHQVFDLEWHECRTCYPGWPATKAERSLLEVFHLQPLPELCRYTIHRGDRADKLACQYLQRISQTGSDPEGRYPVVLLHYEGNTSSENKNLPESLAKALCEDILAAGMVPVVLDWDRRTSLADGKRVHCPGVEEELWGRTGTGDAEALAALIEHSALLVGIDSGPLHVAGATTTPTIGVWRRHHPLHYFGLADHVMHLVPEGHESLLRGNRFAGADYFRKHYRHKVYQNLETDLRTLVQRHPRPRTTSDGLVHQRGFWIREDNIAQDLVIVRDVAEDDCYLVDAITDPCPIVVDIGAHIGCFSKRIHDRNPHARVIAVECCPENRAALEKNVGRFTAVVQAAVTYEPEVALLNAVYAGCRSTGGGTVIDRTELQRRVREGQVAEKPASDMPSEYWADLRPLRTLTLEQLIEEQGLDRIDVLKLDCEGSEFSILRGTRLLDRIGMIVGEYHGKAKFLELVQERFNGWDCRIWRDGDPGTFWLVNPVIAKAKPTGPGKPGSNGDAASHPVAVAPVIPTNGVASCPPLPPLPTKHIPTIPSPPRLTGYGETYYHKQRNAGLDYLAFGEWQDTFTKWIGSALSLRGKRVLDVGCACGALTWGLAQAGAAVHGVDLSEYLIDLGRKQWPDLAEYLHIGDVVHLHFFSADSFDVVHAVQVPELWKPELVPFILRELGRVTAPGGLFFAILDTQEASVRQGRRPEEDNGLPLCLRPLSWWHEQLSKAGWEVCTADFAGRLLDHPQSMLPRYDWDWFVARKITDNAKIESGHAPPMRP